MRHLVIITAALAACAPPPEVTLEGSEPSITIAFPQIDGEEVALECLPNPDFVCGVSDPGVVDPYAEQMQLTVVVDIDNLDLSDPYAPDVSLVDGQGHWHVHINNESITSSSTRVIELVTSTDSREVILDVTLRDNEHELLGPRDTIEFTATPSGLDCSALAEDYCP